MRLDWQQSSVETHHCPDRILFMYLVLPDSYIYLYLQYVESTWIGWLKALQ